MMAARAMNMAMLDFLRGSDTNFPDGDVKVKGHPGEWMVTIQSNPISFDFGNDDNLFPLLVGGLELNSLLEFLATFDLIRSDHGDL
jgi:hypothetical protein